MCSAGSADVSTIPAAARLWTHADGEDAMMRRVWRCPTPTSAWTKEPGISSNNVCSWIRGQPTTKKEGSRRGSPDGSGKLPPHLPGKICQGESQGERVSNLATLLDEILPVLRKAPIADRGQPPAEVCKSFSMQPAEGFQMHGQRPSASLDQGEHFRRDMS